jgi:hypothetical protein
MLSSARFATASASDHNRSQRYNLFSRAGAERRRIIAAQCATHSHSKQRAQHAAARRQPCDRQPNTCPCPRVVRVPLSASSRGYETCAASVPRNMYLRVQLRCNAAQKWRDATAVAATAKRGGAMLRGKRSWAQPPVVKPTLFSAGCRAVHQGTLPWYTCAGGWKQRQLVYVRLLRAEEDPARAVVQRHIDRACRAVQCSAVQWRHQWPIARKVVSLLCFRRGRPVPFAVCYRWHRLPIRPCRQCRQCSAV